MKNNHFGKGFRAQLPLQMMVIPGIIFMIVFCYIPIYGIVIAFKSYSVTDTIASAPWVGLENFKIAFEDKFFWESVVNTLAISFLKLLIGFTAPIILSILIFELKNGWFKKVVQTISYLPHFLSWIVVGGMLLSWLSTSGILNDILVGVGILDQPRNFMIEAKSYWFIAVLSDVWKEVGWGTIIYLATMSGIDPTYYEAAKIDGASKLQQIFHITLPLMKFIISLMFILAVGGILGSNLDQTLVLINPLNSSHAEVINSYVYKVGLAQGDFSYATAVGLAVSIVSLILVVITNHFTKKMNDNKSVF
ncbi:ABC transporter permease subunit [Caldibacillus lycopersici]|uniref:ABC transporter permease subunit n=1 Tax=Perspicuibacillus lycopersici TaxID=1325689 RepID=A0AAE3IVX7_9BACI|nr:ABC transporter permease subunit [Perspicuibacillus lycopersici]MCU9613065.1 ABC transporter permease subunit [Perspicuibacillus lycopersici]